VTGASTLTGAATLSNTLAVTGTTTLYGLLASPFAALTASPPSILSVPATFTVYLLLSPSAYNVSISDPSVVGQILFLRNTAPYTATVQFNSAGTAKVTALEAYNGLFLVGYSLNTWVAIMKGSAQAIGFE